MAYKDFLQAELAVPDFLIPLANGIVIEAEFGLPKSCLKKNGSPNKEGDRRLGGLEKGIPTDWDNIAKPIQDAVAKTEGGIKDASVMTGLVTKKWGLENKITVWLLLPLEG
jgi:Holliday junction resolvase RusA-like endonuclease